MPGLVSAVTRTGRDWTRIGAQSMLISILYPFPVAGRGVADFSASRSSCTYH
jgi:hypothetical protein